MRRWVSTVGKSTSHHHRPTGLIVMFSQTWENYYTQEEFCINNWGLCLTYEFLLYVLAAMGMSHGSKSILGSNSLLTVVTCMRNNWRMRMNRTHFFFLENDTTITDDRVQDADRSNTILWLFFVVVALGFFVFLFHFTYWLVQLSEIQLRNSAPSRDLWIRIWSPFPTCLYSFMLAWPHSHPAMCTVQHRLCATAQVFPETQQTCSSSQLWQYLSTTPC